MNYTGLNLDADIYVYVCVCVYTYICLTCESKPALQYFYTFAGYTVTFQRSRVPQLSEGLQTLRHLFDTGELRGTSLGQGTQCHEMDILTGVSGLLI